MQLSPLIELITTDSEELWLIEGSTFAMLTGFREDCGDCRAFRPVHQRLAKEFPDIAFFLMDLDKQRCPQNREYFFYHYLHETLGLERVCAKYGIDPAAEPVPVPTSILFHDGEQIGEPLIEVVSYAEYASRLHALQLYHKA